MYFEYTYITTCILVSLCVHRYIDQCQSKVALRDYPQVIRCSVVSISGRESDHDTGSDIPSVVT